jgi:hypothetical protein
VSARMQVVHYAFATAPACLRLVRGEDWIVYS